jgi:hypothetical protein
MAALSCDPKTGIYHIYFRFGGRQFHKSLKTDSERKAEGWRAQIDETLHDLELSTTWNKQGWAPADNPVRLAILADALDEAGSDNEEVLPPPKSGPHVRGCFPVDLILGKT